MNRPLTHNYVDVPGYMGDYVDASAQNQFGAAEEEKPRMPWELLIFGAAVVYFVTRKKTRKNPRAPRARPKFKRKSPKPRAPVNWFFRWLDDEHGFAGYNSVFARTKAEALKKARALGATPKGSKRRRLVVDVKTLKRDEDFKRTDAMNRQFD